MNTYQDLLAQFNVSTGKFTGSDFIHATLAAYGNRFGNLQRVVESLVGQVDTLHVFLNDFDSIPGFLDHDRIYISRSQDFGRLGESGKYYWTDDIGGYHFICSDLLIYPADYVHCMISRIENLQRKMIVTAGGYQMTHPFTTFSQSTVFLAETAEVPEDLLLKLFNDQALAYHSSTLHVSRHYFYQPELSALWFSVMALEQKVQGVCVQHDAEWIKPSEIGYTSRNLLDEQQNYRTFLVKSYITQDQSGPIHDESKEFNNYFDKVFVMNLDRRPDRWLKIRQKAEKHQLEFFRFPAVDGYLEPVRSEWEKYNKTPLQALPEGIEPLRDFSDKFTKYHHYIARIHFMETKLGRKAVQSPGALGYALTYIKILKEAIRYEYNRILIFDDDIILHKSFREEFSRHIAGIPEDWKLILLGAMQHSWDPWIQRFSDLAYHCHGSSVASHAVGISRKAFLPLLYYAEKLDLPIDEGAVFHVQNIYDNQCFVFLPNLAIQDMRESDISTSAMKMQDMDRWMKLFRWDRDDYDDEVEQAKTDGI